MTGDEEEEEEGGDRMDGRTFLNLIESSRGGGGGPLGWKPAQVFLSARPCNFHELKPKVLQNYWLQLHVLQGDVPYLVLQYRGPQ